MGKKNGKKGKGGLVLASMGGSDLAKSSGSGPQLKQGASDVLWEGGASYGFAKWLQGEIASIYAKHNLVEKLTKIDEKKPGNEAEAKKEIKGLLLKIGVGGVFGRRMLANNGDLAAHATTAAIHQAAGEAARI